MLNVIAERVTFFRTVDAAEADTLRVGIVQDLRGVAIEDGVI